MEAEAWPWPQRETGQLELGVDEGSDEAERFKDPDGGHGLGGAGTRGRRKKSEMETQHCSWGPPSQTTTSAVLPDITPLKRTEKHSWQEFSWEQTVGLCQEF